MSWAAGVHSETHDLLGLFHRRRAGSWRARHSCHAALSSEDAGAGRHAIRDCNAAYLRFLFLCALAGWTAGGVCRQRREGVTTLGTVSRQDGRAAAPGDRRRALPILVARQPDDRLLHGSRSVAYRFGGRSTAGADPRRLLAGRHLESRWRHRTRTTIWPAEARERDRWDGVAADATRTGSERSHLAPVPARRRPSHLLCHRPTIRGVRGVARRRRAKAGRRGRSGSALRVTRLSFASRAGRARGTAL